MQTSDVLIVGGGPAGSSCAWRLRRAGLDVLVLDRKQFPRDKTCAGWVTPQVLKTLDIDLDEYRTGRTLQPITGFRTGLIGGEEVFTRYAEPVSYGIRRCEFDHFLLERSGAPCVFGESFASAKYDEGHWAVNGRFRAPLLIGAGGHFCPVARMLGNRRDPQSSVVTAQEIEFEVPAESLDRVHIDAEIPELYFCPDLTGYGWCFRKGNFLNIGLGRIGADQLSTHVAGFCEFLRERGKLDVEIPARFHGHAYQLYERVQPKLLRDGALLIGDAAGLAYPQSGEGIRPAVESGLLAAEVILSAAGRFSAEALQPYEAKIRERFGAPRQNSWAARLPAGWLSFLAARLMTTHWFARKVVLDEWFLHRNQPVLSL